MQQLHLEFKKMDEMRKSFISDVSHEFKTPIALIQGYSEGLLENVNTDEESKKFYAEVKDILDILCNGKDICNNPECILFTITQKFKTYGNNTNCKYKTIKNS